MNWTEIPSGKLHAAEQRLRVAFGEKADVIVERINADPFFVRQIADYIMVSAGIKEKSTEGLNLQWLNVREIMAKNFFGVEEAIKYLGISPTPQQLANLSEIPFAKTTLKELKNSHILVAVFPVSIFEIQAKTEANIEQKLFAKPLDSAWYKKEPFVKEQGEASWQLVSKTSVADSILKNWQEQQLLLSENDKVPTAQILVYTAIGYFLATGERLFEHTYVRTSSLGSDNTRVIVGCFNSEGIGIGHCWDEDRFQGLAITSSKRSSQ